MDRRARNAGHSRSPFHAQREEVKTSSNCHGVVIAG